MYLRARWYSPALGRFAQVDPVVGPLAAPATWQPYAYALNNPARYTDASGEFIETIADIAFIAYDIVQIKEKGPNWETGLALAADVGGALLPGLTGAGALVRAAGRADDIADAARLARAASRADDIADAARLVRAASRADDIADVARLPGAASRLDNTAGALRIAPFGDSSRAAEYGIRPYGELRKELRGTGLYAHHIHEKRFAARLGIDPDRIPAVAVTREEHQWFTNECLKRIGRRNMKTPVTTRTATLDDIWAAEQEIYARYPALLEAARRTLGM